MRDDAASVRGILQDASRQIARLDAEVLLAHLMGLDRLEMLRDPDREVPHTNRFAGMVERRMRNEPVAYITGTREFWSLQLMVTPATLIPRPDSETLISEALRVLAGRPPKRILDLGTGSGALLLAALSEWPQATGVGIDCSPDALGLARANAAALGLATRADIRSGDWAHGLLDERFDLVLCNPPYIKEGADLMPDVAEHEPAGALFGGPDGLTAYRRLLPDMPRLLEEGGVALFEFGVGQADALVAMAGGEGLCAEVANDLSGRPRVLLVRSAKALGKVTSNV